MDNLDPICYKSETNYSFILMLEAPYELRFQEIPVSLGWSDFWHAYEEA